MNSFGNLIRTSRENLKLPLRKVAAELDIDTSILSKIERGERNATPDMIPILSELLNIEFKPLQVLFLSNRIFNEFGAEKHIMDGLSEAIEIIRNSKS